LDKRRSDDARGTPTAGDDVQLRGAGGAGSGAPPAEADPGDGGSGAVSAPCRVRGPVLAHNRSSVPPEYLLRATLLQILYSVRSERLLVEQIDYNLRLRGVIGLSMNDAVWDHSTFNTKRDRLLGAESPGVSSGSWWTRRAERSCCPTNTSVLTAR